MRVLGIDLGARRIGIALWDDPIAPARPVETLPVTAKTAIPALLAVIAREHVDEVVIGLPLQLDGREGLAARQARRVAEELARRIALPIHLQDERMTTTQAQAHRHLAGGKGREGIDARAAAIVLQTFMDRRNRQWQLDDDA